MRSGCKGVHRSGVSTRMAALLVVVLEGPDAMKIAYMSGIVLPSHEVQYIAVKSGEAGRSSSGNMSQEFRSGREAIEDKLAGVEVSETGRDPGGGGILGSRSSVGPFSAGGVEGGSASARSSWIA